MSAILFSRTIGPVPVDVIVREEHESELGITEEPVEEGANVSDHAFIMPKRLRLDFADENATATYNALVRFQESRTPVTIISGLYVYQNMLIKRLRADRDETYANVLPGSADLQEVVIVSTSYAASEGDTTAANGGTGRSSGQPGGKGSTTSARPSSTRAGDSVTADRASGTVMRGDAPEKTVPTVRDRSILDRLVN